MTHKNISLRTISFFCLDKLSLDGVLIKKVQGTLSQHEHVHHGFLYVTQALNPLVYRDF